MITVASLVDSWATSSLLIIANIHCHHIGVVSTIVQLVSKHPAMATRLFHVAFLVRPAITWCTRYAPGRNESSNLLVTSCNQAKSIIVLITLRGRVCQPRVVMSRHILVANVRRCRMLNCSRWRRSSRARFHIVSLAFILRVWKIPFRLKITTMTRQ